LIPAANPLILFGLDFHNIRAQICAWRMTDIKELVCKKRRGIHRGVNATKAVSALF
jgi:hypothetical protein